jgi:hypothetical protein
LGEFGIFGPGSKRGDRQRIRRHVQATPVVSAKATRPRVAVPFSRLPSLIFGISGRDYQQLQEILAPKKKPLVWKTNGFVGPESKGLANLPIP